MTFWEMESNLSGQLIPFLCQAYTGWCSHTSAYAEVCIEARGAHGWAFAGSFPAACGHSIQQHACCIGRYESP